MGGTNQKMHRAAGFGSPGHAAQPVRNGQSLSPVRPVDQSALMNNLPSLDHKRNALPTVLSDEQNEQAREIFKGFDKDGNGIVDHGELEAGVRQLLGDNMSEEMIKVQVKQMWEARSDLFKGMDFEEFKQVINTLKLNKCIDFEAILEASC